VLGESVTEAVITVPAHFDTRQRRATMDAGHRAGLAVRRLLDEPIAAALSHGYDGRGGYTLVFDLGGAGCGVTALRVGPGEFDVLAVAGGRGPGGVDWDDELVGLLRRKFLETGGVPQLDDVSLEAALRAQAERARHRLSRVDRASVRFRGSAGPHSVAVTRAEFERATARLVECSRARVESVMRESGLTWIDVDQLLVVGGATRMPMVRRMLEGMSGLQVATSTRPEEEIALGAAIQAHLIEADGRGCAAKWTPLLSRPPSGSVRPGGPDDPVRLRLSEADLPRRTCRKRGAVPVLRRKGPFCGAARRLPASGAVRSAVTIARLESLRPDSPGGLMRGIESLLGVGGFRRIERHNTRSVGFVTEATDIPLFVKAEYGECSATHREADWYSRVARRLPRSTAYIASVCGRNHAVVVLRYLGDAATLDESAARGAVDAGQTLAVVRRMLELDERLLLSSGTVRIDPAKADVFTIRHLRRRSASLRFGFLRRLILDDGLEVDGAWLPSPDRCLAVIDALPALHRYLTPTRYGQIHGDLHGGNILLSAAEVCLIDPNGSPLLPRSYDDGKILHSLQGGYGAIMSGAYELESLGNRRIRLAVRIPASYREAADAWIRTLSDRRYAQALYAEAMHFVAMLPHYAAEPEETTVLYLTACRVFQQLFAVLSVSAPRG